MFVNGFSWIFVQKRFCALVFRFKPLCDYSGHTYLYAYAYMLTDVARPQIACICMHFVHHSLFTELRDKSSHIAIAKVCAIL